MKSVIKMIKINNVTKSYGKSFIAVNNLKLDIKAGEIFGFIGPNGAGKTTTIKMMTGVTSADKGYIKIDGTDIAIDPLKAKKKFGFVPDNPDMFLRLKGIEYLNFIGDMYEVNKADRHELIERLSKGFEINDVLNDQIQTYSHGMRQKIVLIGALLHNPKVWILDEPLTGLDPKSSFKLKEMMKQHVKQGNVVFFSTHVLEVAEKLCDRIGIINKGNLVFEGTIDQLKKKYKSNKNLESIFLEITKDE
jgi:ABC-2 type transport system ATP-binding protein